MQARSLGDLQCPIARGVAVLGDPWSLMILRDACQGLTRFDEFATSLGIAPAMLTRRLRTLTQAGLLDRRRYSDHPPRHEYRLTASGEDFRPVLWALLGWANRHLAPEGEALVLVDAATGARADPMLVDRTSLRPLAAPAFRAVPGPAAGEDLRRRHEMLNLRRNAA